MDSRIPPVLGIIGIVFFLFSMVYAWFSLDLMISTNLATVTTEVDIIPAKNIQVQLSGYSMQSLTEDQLRPLQKMEYLPLAYGYNIFEIISLVILAVLAYLTVYTAYEIARFHKQRGVGTRLMIAGTGGLFFLIVVYLILSRATTSFALQQPVSLGLLSVNWISFYGITFGVGSICLIVAAGAVLCAGLLYKEIERTTMMV